MKKVLVYGMLLAGVLVGTQVAMAHHSFSAEFDRQKPVKLEGVVTKVVWTNPHVWIYLNVKDDSGKVTHWVAETGNATSLARQGINKDTVKPGDCPMTDQMSRAFGMSFNICCVTVV